MNTPMDIPTKAGTDRPRRRGTILGVGAGMLGGGLVGLAMTVPMFTSAATDATATTITTTTGTTAAALQEADGTDAGTFRRQLGIRLRGTLQALVDDGTLTAEQADAVTQHLLAERHDRDIRRGHRGGRRGGHPGMDGEVVAELLGIDAAELRAALRDGQSIADLAEANGVDVATIVDALVADADRHLDLAVENGRLTEDEAAERLAELTERITTRVDRERPSAG